MVNPLSDKLIIVTYDNGDVVAYLKEETLELRLQMWKLLGWITNIMEIEDNIDNRRLWMGIEEKVRA